MYIYIVRKSFAAKSYNNFCQIGAQFLLLMLMQKLYPWF